MSVEYITKRKDPNTGQQRWARVVRRVDGSQSVHWLDARQARQQKNSLRKENIERARRRGFEQVPHTNYTQEELSKLDHEELMSISALFGNKNRLSNDELIKYVLENQTKPDNIITSNGTSLSFHNSEPLPPPHTNLNIFNQWPDSHLQDSDMLYLEGLHINKIDKVDKTDTMVAVEASLGGKKKLTLIQDEPTDL